MGLPNMFVKFDDIDLLWRHIVSFELTQLILSWQQTKRQHSLNCEESGLSLRLSEVIHMDFKQYVSEVFTS